MFEIGLDGFVEVRTENTLCSQQTVRSTKLSNWSAPVLLFHPRFCWQFITIKVNVWVWDPFTCQRDLSSFAFQISCQTLLKNPGNECEWDQPNDWSFVCKIRVFIKYLRKNKRGHMCTEHKRLSEKNWLFSCCVWFVRQHFFVTIFLVTQCSDWWGWRWVRWEKVKRTVRRCANRPLLIC